MKKILPIVFMLSLSACDSAPESGSNYSSYTCSNYLTALDIINDPYSTMTDKNMVTRERNYSFQQRDEYFKKESNEEQKEIMNLIDSSPFKIKKMFNLLNYCEKNLNDNFLDVAFIADKALISSIKNDKGFLRCSDAKKDNVDIKAINRLRDKLLGEPAFILKKGNIYASKYSSEPESLSIEDVRKLMIKNCDAYNEELPLFLALGNSIKNYVKEKQETQKIINTAIREEYKIHQYDSKINYMGNSLISDIGWIINKEQKSNLKEYIKIEKSKIRDDIHMLAKNKVDGTTEENKKLLTDSGELKSIVEFKLFIEEKTSTVGEVRRLWEELESSRRHSPQDVVEYNKKNLDDFISKRIMNNIDI